MTVESSGVQLFGSSHSTGSGASTGHSDSAFHWKKELNEKGIFGINPNKIPPNVASGCSIMI